MKYAPEQMAAIIGFVDDFATWVNTQLDKEMSKIAEISFAVTPERVEAGFTKSRKISFRLSKSYSGRRTELCSVTLVNTRPPRSYMP